MYIQLFIILLFSFYSPIYSEQRFSFSKEYDQECSTNNKSGLDAEMDALKCEPFIAISLGENCFPALHIKEHGIRIRSFPFDWNITPFNALYSLIKNDFDGFLEFRNLGINKKENTMYSKKYKFKLNHDFDIAEWIEGPDGIVPSNNLILEKYKRTVSYYQRRIARFYSVFDLGVPLYLLRRVITASEAHKLCTLLKIKFPQSKFTLICIQDENWEPAEHWKNLPDDIVYIKMDRAEDYQLGQRNHVWTKLLTQLGLLRN